MSNAPQTCPVDNGPASILVGLLGRGISLSQSPRMHEAEGRRLGLNYVYRRLDFDCMALPDDELGRVLAQCEAFGFSGVNVTHPFKQKILALLDRLSPEAEAIGAVNTVVFANGERVGHNTDCSGFAQSFREGLATAERRVAVLVGAGGAGTAVCRALVELGFSRVLVFDRDRTAASATAAALSGPGVGTVIEPASDLEAAIAGADGVINATPVGMASYPGSAVPLAALTPRHWVADIVYFPEETELIAAARARGCAVLPGGGMAVHQAVRAFELFSGLAPSAPAMAAARTAG